MLWVLLAPLATHAAPATSATDPSTAPADVQITLAVSTEEGKKQLVATVRAAGKPAENATVSFGAARTFGELMLGKDQTLDDGTAAVPFPTDLPTATGSLTLSATITAPAKCVGARTVASFPGGKAVATDVQPFPRALWAPQAPVALIAIIFLLLSGAWGAYVFVAAQLLAIRKGATP